MNIFARLFFKFYPSQKKHADTEEGTYLRRLIGVCVFFHVALFVASLVSIGFLQMLFELFFVAWTYSCFLTLHEWQIVIYLLLLLFGIAHGVLNIFAFQDISLLFFILCFIFYSFAFYFVGSGYVHFRQAGGIHGTNGKLKKKKKSHKKQLIEDNENVKVTA